MQGNRGERGAGRGWPAGRRRFAANDYLLYGGFIKCQSLLQFVVHVTHDIPRIKNLDAGAIRHKNGVHFEVDDHINPEDAASVVSILT